MNKIEYFPKYDWYGYEGVGYCRGCEYTSDDISNCYQFINDEEFRNNELKVGGNGFVEKIYPHIYKRNIVETIADYKKELRNEKINNIMN